MSAIGDVVHTLPLATSIRAAAPSARITWLIQAAPLELVRHHPAVDDFLLFDRQAPVRGLASLRRRLGGRRFDLLIVPQTSAKAALATLITPAGRKLGYDRARAPELSWLATNERIAPRPRAHQQDEVLEFVRHLGIPPRLDYGLGPTREEVERFGDLLPAAKEPTVALGLASSHREKNWPAERYAELAVRLVRDHRARVVLVGGRSDAENAVAAAIAARAAALDLRARDLRRLAYLLDRSDVYIGPDSAPLHIAVALGTPSVALMGYTNPLRFGPYRFREWMVDGFGEPGEAYTASEPPRAGRMSRIAVEQVEQRVGAILHSRHDAPAVEPGRASEV